MSSDDRGVLLPDMPTSGRVLLALCVLALGHSVGLAIYRVYWHPLRHFPGPLWYAVSGLPAFYLTWTGQKVAFLERVHREYGDAVRIAPDELSMIGADAWKDTHGHSAKPGVGRTPLPKHWDKYVHSPNGAYNLFDAPDGEHARMRKFFQPAFSYGALQAHESLVQERVNHLILRLRESVGENVDLVRLFNFTTFDIMSTLAFGDSLRMLEQDEYCPWVRAMFDFIKIDARMNALGQLVPPVRALAGCLFGRLIRKKKAEHFRFCEERVSHRLAAEPQQPDIWKLSLENKKQSQRLTREEIDSNAFVLMVAGTETVATSLSGLVYLLLKHPEAMARLTEEVRSAFDETTPEMTSRELKSLCYLSACIKETLRLYPPTPTGSARLVLSQGSTVCGLPIPGGSTIYVSHRAMYTSDKYFKDPYRFVPERWLEEKPYEADNTTVHQPFSYGPRDCIGKRLANLEMQLIAAKLFYCFDVELCHQHADRMGQATFFFWEKGPLEVRLKPASIPCKASP